MLFNVFNIHFLNYFTQLDYVRLGQVKFKLEIKKKSGCLYPYAKKVFFFAHDTFLIR
jgi:hypothetical protein